MIERLANQAPLARPGDELTQRYADRSWRVRDSVEATLLVYNRDRKQFEITDVSQRFVNWVNGLSDPQPINEILEEAKIISGNYGRSVGAWYILEHGSSRLSQRSRDLVRFSAEFVRDRVPYGYSFPFIDKLTDL